MKNTTFRNLFLAVAVGITAALALTSCDDDYWDPVPPYGWNNDFYDSRLDGYWQLIQYGSQPIGPSDTNYMFFNGSGRGVYYYLLNGRPYSELMAYWCQRTVVGASSFQMNIRYQSDSNPTTVNYWFSAGELWMQWRNQSGIVTSVYRRYPGAPW